MTFIDSLLRMAGLLPAKGRWRITGPYKGITGYDRVVRSIVPLLRERGVEVELQELKHWSPTKMREPLPRDLTRRRPLGKVDLHLHFGMPTQVVCSPDCRNINFSMFEASRIPATWAKATEKFDLVVVPTESSRESWVRGGVPIDKVRLCPMGADFDLFVPLAPPLELATRDGRPVSAFRHRFLNVAEFITRKNLSGLLRVWLQFTTAADDAVLILKPGFYAPGRREAFAAELQLLETEAGKSFMQAAPIVLSERQIAEAEMPRHYTAATHYWSMSFGEGFDLPMVEAAACNLQLIAPFHSSYRHYLTPVNAFLIPVDEVDAVIPNDLGLADLFRGSQWWRPAEAQAGAIIRQIVDGAVKPLPSSRVGLQQTCRFENMADTLLQVLADQHGATTQADLPSA